jgi:PAS domain S-box-containing protein
MADEKTKLTDERALERSREWELIEIRENFRTLAENALDGIIIVMSDGRIVYANPMASKISGYDHAKLLSVNFSQLIHPNEREMVTDRFAKRLNGEDVPPHYETVLLRSDKQSVPVEINATPTIWQGHRADMISCRDISKPKRAEAQLRESQRVFTTLMSNLPGMAFRCGNDPNWTMQFVSEGCLALTGYSFRELVENREIAYGDMIHRDDQQRVWDEVQKCLNAKKPWRLEYRIVTKIGRIAWVWEQGRGVFDDDGKLLHLEGFVTDISERKLAEQELEKTEERRRRTEQLAYVGELAARLNHEIKNPLATIRAGLEILDRELEMEASNRHVLTTIIREVKHVSGLVTDLLNVARPESFNPMPVDLIPVILNACDPFLHIARRKGIDFNIDLPDDPIIATVDVKAFYRFLGNLVINASDVLGSQGRIEVRAKKLEDNEIDLTFPDFPSDVVEISVSDNGPGIPKDILSKILEPFFTTKSSGTGLGLAVAADIIESHGGKLIVENKNEGGAVFTAYLPIVDYNVDDHPSAAGPLPQNNLGLYYCGEK